MGWAIGAVDKFVDIYSQEVVLFPIANTALGFQLHFTDIFLEELAKVGGESFDSKILNLFLEPFILAVKDGQDDRYRDHIVERIFNHLIRQSDAGIKWQMEEDGYDVNENDEDEESEAKADEEEESPEGAEDPRAGNVDSYIPQIQVEYLQLSERLFELGSLEGVRKGNRDALYKVSKMYKDVASGQFPLGPNLSDEEIDIPRISVKQSAAELMKRNEEILKKNKEEKIKNKNLMA